LADVILDIATKLIGPDQKIWAMFPGTGRKFFGIFATEDLIFLDTPGLAVSEKILHDDTLLRKHVAMSEAWSNYYYWPDDKPPSTRVEDYRAKRNPSFNARVGNVRNVFRDMKPGDLVLVGASSQYDPVLIGELIEPYDPKVFTYYEKYGRDKIPARRVKWLRTDFERRQLSQGLSRLLSNRRTVITVSEIEYGEEVYQIAYGDYVYGEHSRYIYEGKKYKNIGLAIKPGLDLLSYFIAAYHACEEDEIVNFAGLDVNKAINSYFEQEILNSFEVDFRSPGEYVLNAKKAALPLLVAILVSATSGSLTLTEARAAEVKNTASGKWPVQRATAAYWKFKKSIKR
jgi:hypothetical protein